MNVALFNPHLVIKKRDGEYEYVGESHHVSNMPNLSRNQAYYFGIPSLDGTLSEVFHVRNSTRISDNTILIRAGNRYELQRPSSPGCPSLKDGFRYMSLAKLGFVQTVPGYLLPIPDAKREN